MGAQQVGAEAVDEQQRHPAGAAEGLGQTQRVGREVAALHRDPERGRSAGEDVGQRGLPVTGAQQVRRQEAGGHGRAARTCSPVATSR